jgi:flagellar motor switch/type III secretory pathway protein FliN
VFSRIDCGLTVRWKIFCSGTDMAETAVVAETQNAVADPDAWEQVLPLPCRLTVDVPLPGFTVADALRLRRSSVINSHWRVGTDIPLRLNGELIARGEFEVVGNHLAVRITELV